MPPHPALRSGVAPIFVVALVIAGVLVTVGAVRTRKRAALPPVPKIALAEPPWDRLDDDTWTLDREQRPTVYFTQPDTGRHRAWVHYTDTDVCLVSDFTVDAFVAPASPSSRAVELPGLPDGLAGSVSFEGEGKPEPGMQEQHIALAREWLSDAGPLTALPGSRLSIDASRSGGFRIHIYWEGTTAEEVAAAVRVIERVEGRMVPMRGSDESGEESAHDA